VRPLHGVGALLKQVCWTRAPTRTCGELRHAVLAVLEGAQVQSAVHGSPHPLGLLLAGHLRLPMSPT